ncbi:hypothetical protein J3458_016823 [Metarhizium acridum]|uniref:uncharacterized protein n=1 Tax=Metarhizium acridum TaxID=92637 RepID=UPI001C6C3298|nr:hypothetical protein J3458_016823 [Metarhizium acridum]
MDAVFRGRAGPWLGNIGDKHRRDWGDDGVVQSDGNPLDASDMIRRVQTSYHQTQGVFRTSYPSYGRRITTGHSRNTPSSPCYSLLASAISWPLPAYYIWLKQRGACLPKVVTISGIYSLNFVRPLRPLWRFASVIISPLVLNNPRQYPSISTTHDRLPVR